MIKIIKEVNKEDLKHWLYNINIDDPNLYKELENPHMIGIFQLTGNTARRLVNDIHPKDFREVNAVNAMARPGPIENAQVYEARKAGAVSPYPEIMNEILSDTYGVPLFQEQIMEIFHKIGGFSLEEANEVRGLMKKLGKAEQDSGDLKKWDKTVKKFIRGAIKNNIDEKMAKRIAEELVSFSSYSFNLSHSTSYTYIAMMTLYLSFYFRKYFYSAFATQESDKKLLEVINSIKAQGFEILPPNINKSGLEFTPLTDCQILFPLTKIKHISDKSSVVVTGSRPYKSLFDFIIKTRCRTITSSVIKALISVGAFDKFDKNRKKLLFIFNKFWERKKAIKIEEKLKALYDEIAIESDRIPGLETTISDLMGYEKEYFGFNFFATLFTRSRVKAFVEMSKRKLINLGFYNVSPATKKTPVVVESIRRFKDRNDNEMAFIEIQDMFGNREKIPVFHSYYKFIGNELVTNEMYLMNLFRSNDGKVMFGQNGWLQNEFRIRRMLRVIE